MNTGVYLITCVVSHTIYVGSAARSFNQRWSQHVCELHKGVHPNKHLQAAWNKYGEENFQFTIAERCSPERCWPVEQRWLDILSKKKRLYNTCLVAGSHLGVKRSEETKRKISLTSRDRRHSEETKNRMSKVRKGRVFSEEHKKNLSKALKGRIFTEQHRRNLSLALSTDEAKQKMSLAQKGRQKSEEHRSKLSQALTGKKLSEEHKKRISEGLRSSEAWKDYWDRRSGK